MTKPIPLKVLARRIQEHLTAIEASPTRNPWNRGIVNGTKPYYRATAYVAGTRLGITYVNYQGTTTLTQHEATAYLNFLDAGHTDKHYPHHVQAHTEPAATCRLCPKAFEGPHTQSLARRVTMTYPDKVITIDTLAHESREVQIGSIGAEPVTRFEQDGVHFCQRGNTRPRIEISIEPS